MLTLRHLLLALVTVLFLYACTKDNDLPQSGGERLQKIIYHNDSMFQVAFFYDEQGRLSAIEDSNSQTHIGRTVISYNGQNKMVKVTQMRYFASRSNLLYQLTDSFVYDQNNRITKRLMLTSRINTDPPIYTTLNAYSYDGQGRLVADTTYSSYNNSLVGYTLFTNDANDNIVQVESFSRTSGTLRSNGIITATYNTQKNPVQSLGMAAYLLFWEEGMVLSKYLRNNLHYPNGNTRDYSYENYSNGLTRKITDTYKTQNNTSQATIEFFYQ